MTVPDELKPQKLFPVACSLFPVPTKRLFQQALTRNHIIKHRTTSNTLILTQLIESESLRSLLVTSLPNRKPDLDRFDN
jgi:hypothetical protein